MQLEGKVAVVTGGASGIGLGTALALAKRGAEVVIADLNQARLDEAQKQIAGHGHAALALRCDVRSDSDVDALAQRALGWRGRVDVLMNNAGVALLGPPERVPIADWQWILDVNVLGLVRGVRAFLPQMLERGSGHVVNTASVAGLLAYSYDAGPYITSKFAAVGFSESLAVYARPFGVGVSVLCPGLVTSNLGETARFAGVTDLARWSHFPDYMRRPLAPEQVGEMVCDAVEADRYLILTHAEFAPVLAERHRDLDAALRAQVASAPMPPRGA